MLKREIYLEGIAHSLALLSKEVEIRNAVNLYDINIVAEDFFSGLLNLIYGYELKNINNLEKNAPAIDLYDSKNKVSIQVTSDNDSAKIKHTISEFNQNRFYEIYDRLIVLILTQKKKYSTDFDTEGKFTFDKEKDIWDVESLIKDIRELELDKLKKINEYLLGELDDKCYALKRTQASEIDTIMDLIEYISQNRDISERKNVIVDPEYKIYKRFHEFANKITSDYTTLLGVYGDAIETIN